jgi:hypothetical protein
VTPGGDPAEGDMAEGLNEAPLPVSSQPAPLIELPDGVTTAMLVDFAAKRKAQHKRWFGDSNGYSEKIMDWWRGYDGKTLPGQNVNTTVPICHSVVETDVAKSMEALLNQAKVVDALPKVPQKDNENKETIEDLINQEILWSQARTQRKLYGAVKGCKIEGSGIGRVEWEKRMIETIPDPTVLDLMTNERVQTKTVMDVKVYKEVHGPSWDVVPIQNFGWDNRVSDIRESEWVFEMHFVNRTDLLLMRDEGKITDIETIFKQASGADAETTDPEAKRKARLSPASSGPQEADGDDKVWKLDEWFAWVPYEKEDGTGWGKTSLHFFICNGNVVVNAKKNEWVDDTGNGLHHPYFNFRQELVPRQMLGNAVHDAIMGLQVYVNNLQGSNQKLIHKAASNPTFVSRAAGLDTLRIFTEELSVIPVLDASQIKTNPIDAGSITAVTNERAWSINMARETVAANEQMQGIPRENMSNATATEASLMNANSGMRFQLVVDLMKHEIFGSLATMFWWMIRQWAKDGDLVVRESSLDGAPRAILRSDLENDYFFVPITSAMMNDQRASLQQQIQLAQQLITLQQQNPAAFVNDQGVQFKFSIFDYLVEEIFPKAGIRNGHSFLKPVAPAAPPMAPPGAAAPMPQVNAPLAPAPQFQALAPEV